MLFSSLGVIVGIYAETFDHHTFVNNIIILPLAFLGGVFYSVRPAARRRGRRSPTPTRSSTWSARCATGSSARPTRRIGLSLGVTAVLAAATVFWSSYLFRTGRKLKA